VESVWLTSLVMWLAVGDRVAAGGVVEAHFEAAAVIPAAGRFDQGQISHLFYGDPQLGSFRAWDLQRSAD
jgi:hypothetical protein